jgi:hypothetical protein
MLTSTSIKPVMVGISSTNQLDPEHLLTIEKINNFFTKNFNRALIQPLKPSTVKVTTQEPEAFLFTATTANKIFQSIKTHFNLN